MEGEEKKHGGGRVRGAIREALRRRGMRKGEGGCRGDSAMVDGGERGKVTVGGKERGEAWRRRGMGLSRRLRREGIA